MSKKAPSRNSPCPCGSGKKYKVCCLHKDSNDDVEALRQRVRQAEQKLVTEFLKHTKHTLGMPSMHEAWEEFILFREERPFDFESPENQAFFPWFFYNWKQATIVQSYLEKYRWRLSETERKFIELCCATDYSFFEVLECRPGTGFTLKDLLSERQISVTDQSASQAAQKAQILFAKVIQYDHVGLIVGSASILIPPIHKPLIIDLRAAMRSESGAITDEVLHEWEAEIRELYLEIYDRIHTPPKLHNTDGDPIVWHELLFETTSAQVAFERLKSLALDMPEDELLSDAEFDSNGRLKKVEFSWFKEGQSTRAGMQYTSLGWIKIDDQKLTAVVNSRNRAIKIRNEIEQRLGDQATLKVTEVKTMESLLAERPDLPKQPSPSEVHPEIEEAMQTMLENNWQQWIDTELPALGGVTPRQAIKDKDGYEKVMALLDHFEEIERAGHSGLNQLKHIQRVRKQLDLK